MAERFQYNLTRDETVAKAKEIAKEYARDGMTLTLRQLYYQFVGRGLELNDDKVYNRLGATLTDARYDGRFPINHLEDRGRDTGSGDWTTNDDDVDDALDNSADAIKSCPYWYIRRSRWWGQEKIVSVWVEKEALAGVFEQPCTDLGVSLFPCKGYPSVSALTAWLKSATQAREAFHHEFGWAPDPIILYFGDHDPDGFEIPRAALRGLYRLQKLDGHDFDIDMQRLALNLNQILKYKPPPFPAKKTSSRYASYKKEHGIDDAWELDALEPRVLRQLIRDRVTAHFDQATHARNQAHIRDLRRDLRDRIQDPNWLAQVLTGA